MVNFQCRGVLLIWIIVGQGRIVVGIFFSRLSVLTSFFLSSGRQPDID